MKNSEVPMMALRRAVQICGGIDALGDALNVSTETLELMRIGEEEIPLPHARSHADAAGQAHTPTPMKAAEKAAMKPCSLPASRVHQILR